jgi:hypothetical protein
VAREHEAWVNTAVEMTQEEPFQALCVDQSDERVATSAHRILSGITERGFVELVLKVMPTRTANGGMISYYRQNAPGPVQMLKRLRPLPKPTPTSWYVGEKWQDLVLTPEGVWQTTESSGEDYTYRSWTVSVAMSDKRIQSVLDARLKYMTEPRGMRFQPGVYSTNPDGIRPY